MLIVKIKYHAALHCTEHAQIRSHATQCCTILTVSHMATEDIQEVVDLTMSSPCQSRYSVIFVAIQNQ